MVVDGFFRGLASAGKLHPKARPERHNVELIRDVPYRESGAVEHLLDVYRPASNPGLLPIAFYVHGGGFRILSKDTHWLMGLIFARRGYVVFNIGYRLAPRSPYPAAVEDTCAAFDWVVKNAARYGGDPSRIVLAGESAGGNLVTALALALAYRREEAFAERVWSLGVVPRAVVPACAVLQVSDPERFHRANQHLSMFVRDRLADVSIAYLSGAADQVSGVNGQPADRLAFADPVVFFERGIAPDRPLPPFFVPVGTRDPLVDDTRRLEVALSRLGVECDARYYEGQHHAFHAMIWRDAARRCWRETFEFLGRHVPSTIAQETHPANECPSSDAMIASPPPEPGAIEGARSRDLSSGA